MEQSTLLVFIISLTFVFTKADPTQVLERKQNTLLDFMTRTGHISRGNPERSMACFDYYVPILNGITTDYETAYTTCLSTAEEAKSEVETALVSKRHCMAANAEAACELLKACGDFNSSIDFFECYVKAGNQNSKTMYGISANASDILIDVREQYRLIEYEENRCTNTAERTYMTKTSATYDELQSCIQGLTPVPESRKSETPQVHNAKPSVSLEPLRSKFERYDGNTLDQLTHGRFGI